MKKKLLHSFFRLLGFVLLGLIAYYTVDFNQFIEQLKSIAIPSIAILLAIATVDRFLMAYKWQQLCTTIGIKLSLKSFISIYYGTSFLGYCLPTTLGGEAYRVIRVSRHADTHLVMASVFIEKIIGIFSTISFAWAGSIYISLTIAGDSRTLLYILIGFTIAAVSATASFFHPSSQQLIIKLASRVKLGGAIDKFTNTYSSYRDKPKILVRNYILAVTENALQLIIMCGVGLALEVDIPLLTLASVIAVTEFVRRVAMILDGWGLATSLQIFMYGLVGMSSTQALLIALLSHAIYFAASFPGGLTLLFDRWEKGYAQNSK